MPRTKKETKQEVSEGRTKRTTKSNDLTVTTYSLKGQEVGTADLPKEIFGGKINKALLAQAVRVYLNNLKGHFSHTKTRSEVKGSTRKIRVQKGTGGARHGSIRAPIFVKGGVALGPKFRKVEFKLPKKMKRAALISALSDKAKMGEVLVLQGVEKVSGKTKQMQELLDKLSKQNILIVNEGKNEMLMRSVRNLPTIKAIAFDQLNVLEIVAHQTVLFTKEAVEKLESKMVGKEKESK